MGIEPVQLHQLAVRAVLDEAAVIQDDDAVRILDGRQAVGDDEGRTPDHEPVQGVLHDALAFRIEGRRGFVQDQDAGVLQDGPGNGDALPLAAGNVYTPVAQLGLVPLGQVEDEVMGIGRLGRRHDFLFRRIEPAVLDVIESRVTVAMSTPSTRMTPESTL